MSTNTTNYNLVKPADNETADILVINANMDTVDAQLKTNADAITTKETPAGAQAKADAVQANLVSHSADNVKHPTYAVTTGSANTYLVAALTVYNDGTGITVKINADSTGVSTLNGKGLKSVTGNDITNLKSGGIYSFRYNSTTSNFIMQGEGVDATSLITATNLILNM